MATDKFRRAHAVTKGWEGGWSNHPADRGRETMYGVTQVKFHEWLRKKGRAVRPVRSITRAEAEELYFEEFWTRAGCEGLFPGVDLATYDPSVNSGVSRGRRWLLAGLDPKDRHDETVKNICRQRLGFVQSLNTWKVFGKGWGNRIADIQAKGVAWALTAMHDAPVVKQQLEDEASASNTKAKAQTTTATGTAATGAGAGTVQQVDPTAVSGLDGRVLAFLIVLALAGAAFLFIRGQINRQQAKAYAAEAAAI